MAGALRADAAKNRDHILAVAHDALAESGETSLNVIAKRAGVGAGTLYRHFPTREALILAVYQHDVERLVASVPDLLRAHPSLDALRAWFETLADYIRVKHGLGEAMHTAGVQDAINATYAPVIGAIGELLTACEADGAIRPDLDPDDVLILMSFMWRTEQSPAGKRKARRVMDLAIDGLRAEST